MKNGRSGGTGGIRTLDTLASTPDFKGTKPKRASVRNRGGSRRGVTAGTANSARYRTKKKRLTENVQGPVVYLLRSFDVDGGEGERGAVERIALHRRMSTLSTRHAHDGEAFRSPFPVGYRLVIEGDDTQWRYSCIGMGGGVDYTFSDTTRPRPGDVIGDGSDEAALAWLLEGEVQRKAQRSRKRSRIVQRNARGAA